MIPHLSWAYPNGSVGLNVKLEHIPRVHINELIAKNALKAEEIKILLDSNSKNPWFASQNMVVGTDLRPQKKTVLFSELRI